MSEQRPITLPPLATMGVGSYATPGWMFPFRKAIHDGSAGADDIDEAFDDATRVVVADQIEAGVDILSDGELRRQRFVYEMYDRLQGIERIRPGRRLGVPGYDMAPSFTAQSRVSAPDGLGLVAECRALQKIAPGYRLKMALPGGDEAQRVLLEEEGVVFDERGRVSLERFQWRPRPGER